MAILFVHGVNTRQSPKYEAGKLATEKYLARHFANARVGRKNLPSDIRVAFPYWGDLASDFAWKMASLPESDDTVLGPDVPPDLRPAVAQLLDATPGELGPQPLTTLAKKRLSLAVDVLCDIALETTTDGAEGPMAEFIAMASAYAEANPAPAWLSGVSSDAQFIAALRTEMATPTNKVALGGFDNIFKLISRANLRLQDAVSKVAGKSLDRAGNFASTKLLAWTREPMNASLGRFFGDVFVYLMHRGDREQPGPIPARILGILDDELRRSPADEPLVIIGHSLGGVITFDILSHFRPEVKADLFISVESQVAFFEEMKLYKESNPEIRGPQKAKTPSNICHWINSYDLVDIFAYSASRVFDRVHDFQYDSETYTVKAHSVCLQQDGFYKRLRARLGELE